MTLLPTLLPIIQAPSDLSLSTLALYLLPTLLSLIIFALGLWLRPLFEKNWPDLFTKNETQPVSKVGISVKEEFVPSATPKDLAKNLEPRPTVTENVSLIPSKSTPTAIELDYINFEYNYCRQVIQLYKKKDFWIATNQQPIPLLREDFFVSPQFSIEDLPKRNVSLRGLLKLSRHLLLLGVPGAGKTETIMSLLLTYARHEAMLRLKSNERLVPILLSVPDVSQQLSATPNLTLSDVLQQKLTPPHKEYVVEKLEEGHFLILVDNFNEIVMTQAFQVADWFEKQIEQFPKNRMVIVIRPFLKEVFNQTGPFTRARFDNLGDDMLKTLTKKWKAVIPDALNTLASIVQEENVYPLAHTPLHLLMLLIVGLTTRTLPNHKTQLYAYYIKTLLAFGQQENTPPLALLSQAEKHYLLQRIAYNLHTNRAVEIEESALNKLVQQILTPINVKVADEAHVFIEFLRRSGLLIEKNGQYRYAHLSFQEFLTAQGQDISEVGLEQILAQNKDDPWWQEVNNFYKNLTNAPHVIDQAFEQETQDLPNIDKNQTYTLGLLINNLSDFNLPNGWDPAMDQPATIFDVDLVNPDLQGITDEEGEKGIKVMVVDDTPQNIQLARFILQRENYTVLEANNAQEALTLIQENKPSLILSDIQMPGMDGYEFCRRLKADPNTQHIPFIFVTAFSRSTKEAARGLQIGADDYITRPFAPEELLARIGANVRIHQAEESARRQATILARRNRELALLNQIQRAVTSSLNLNDVLDATMEQVQKVLKAETTSLWFVDLVNEALVLIATYNDSARNIYRKRLPLYESVSGYAVRSGHPLLSGNIQAHPEYRPSTTAKTEPDTQRIHSMLCVPLRVREKVIGVLQAVHPEKDYFNQDDLHLFNAVGDAVTVAIENAWLFGQIQLFSQQLEQKVEARTHELAREKEKTETILISIADSLLVTDPNNKIIMANRAAEELLDFKFSQAVGQSIEQDRFDTRLWEFVRDINAQSDPTYTAQTEVPDENNSEGILSVQAHAAKMWDPSEQTYTGNVIVLRDVTALQEVDRMKARFMTGITHELKTPLAIMTLHIGSLLKYKSLDENKKLEMLKTTQRQAKLLERLVENILELSRLDAGIQINREPINLVGLSRQIAMELQPLATEKGLTLDFQPAHEVIMVEADANQLERVIRNLTDNAIKYTNQGKITISLFTNPEVPPHGQAILKVADTGIGLSKEQIGKLFERFYRADPSHNIPGTGLGLSIAQEITKKHNGDIQVESSLGQGSTFTLCLPLLT